MSGWGTWPAPVRVRHDDDGEPIMRDGPMLSCAGPAEDPALAVTDATDCLPPALADCLLDSALEPVLDAAAVRGRQAAKRKKNSARPLSRAIPSTARRGVADLCSANQ